MTAPSSASVLAIDVGGTKVAFADVDGSRIYNRHQIPTPRTGRGGDLVEAIDLEIRKRRSEKVAIATTGIVVGGTLTAVNPLTLPIEEGYPLAARLQALTGLKPLIINDAQAAAWGEFRYGAGRGSRNFMFVTVSTGVGGGLVLDGRLRVGHPGLAGHIGHTTVAGTPSPCGCGRWGCVETIASGTAISRRFLVGGGRDAGAPEVFAAASGGNELAERVIDEAAAALAETIANVVAMVDLERVAIGGGVGLAPGFLARVRHHTAALPLVFRRALASPEAGADAGLLGVAALMKENFSAD